MLTIGEFIVCLICFIPIFIITEMFREGERKKAFKKWLDEGWWRCESFEEWWKRKEGRI